MRLFKEIVISIIRILYIKKVIKQFNASSHKLINTPTTQREYGNSFRTTRFYHLRVKQSTSGSLPTNFSLSFLIKTLVTIYHPWLPRAPVLSRRHPPLRLQMPNLPLAISQLQWWQITSDTSPHHRNRKLTMLLRRLIAEMQGTQMVVLAFTWYQP